MNIITVTVGIVSTWYGIFTLFLRAKAPEKFGKLDAMKKMWGEKAGYLVHVVGYSVIPILVGVVLFFAGLNGVAVFGN